MNEDSDATATPTDTDESPPQVVSDNYDRYLQDEYGYAYAARDILSLRILESHDRLADDPHGALGDRTVDDLDDFERFGYARGLADEGDLESFADVFEELLESDDDHDGLQYHELPLYGANVALRHGAAERAHQWLRHGVDRWPYRARPARLLQARIALRADDGERASSIYESLTADDPDDPELFFEIARDLASEGFDSDAADWASRARETAQRVGDTSVEVDIDVLEARLGGNSTA
jgi:predicted Zn-dependent protease